MRKLLSANISRLFNNKSFWIFTVLTFLCEFGYALLLLRKGDSLPRDVILFVSTLFINILFSVFYSLFLGTEYSDGTIRNKIIAGHKRSEVYLSSLITGIVAITVMYIAEVLGGIAVGTLFFDAAAYGIEKTISIGTAGLVACIAFSAVFTLIGMLSSSKAITAIACILTAFGALFLALFTFQRLTSPESLTSAEQAFYKVVFEVNPSGQLLQTMMLEMQSPLRLIIYSSILFVTVTVIGMFIFRKKEFK